MEDSPEDPDIRMCPHIQRLIRERIPQRRISGRRKMDRSQNKTSLIGLFIVFFMLDPVISKKVILLDTKDSDELNWRTYSKSNTVGWLEESFMSDKSSEDMNKRAYVICEVTQPNVSNWVRTPYIPVGEANRVFVQLNFTLRSCAGFPRNVRSCRDTIALLYHQTDSEPGEGEEPPFEISEAGFRGIAPRLSRDSNIPDDKESTATRSIQVTKKGIYFAIWDEGSCASIMSVSIYYQVCEKLERDFVEYPETPAPPGATDNAPIDGRCVNHATRTSTTNPKYHCNVLGMWDIPSGGCACKPGYWGDVASNNRSQTCHPCGPGTYSDKQSVNMSCVSCPAHSHTDSDGSAACECDSGFYRARDEAVSNPCTTAPSKPLNVQIDTLNYHSVSLVWQRPKSDGGRKEMWYRVECKNCGPMVQYTPGTRKIRHPKVTIRGLEPAKFYNVFIYAENEISELPDHRQHSYTIKEIHTLTAASLEVRSFQPLHVGSDRITLTWSPPLILPTISEGNPPGRYIGPDGTEKSPLPPRDAAVKYYEIRMSTDQRPYNVTQVKGSHRTRSFENLNPEKLYTFQIRAVAEKTGTWSPPLQVTTTKDNIVVGKPDGGDYSTEQPSGPSRGDMTVTVAIIVGGIVVLTLLGFVCILIFLFRRGTYRKKQQSDLDVLDYKNGGNHSPADFTQPHYSFVGNSPIGKLTAPLMSNMSPHLPSGVKPYVDPLTYEDPNRALQEFALEIDPNFVYISEIIGAGEFGEVCKGELKVPGRTTQTVAIKTLKSGSPHKARSDFLLEASIQGQFEHPNVISLRGVVTKSEPVMIVTEYMENGSLDAFLKIREGQIGTIHLISIMRDVAAGMKYLSEKGFVHRDLAARNVLVGREFNCKIADFGLSRGLEGSTEQVYTTKGGKIPVRWTAPEGISYRKFTSASDVWSFGVLMWEVVSYGERPYWDWSNQQVIESVEKGYRLPPPEGPNYGCPPALHALMLECWQADKVRRPTFDILLRKLHEFLRNPDLLRETPSTSPSSMSTPLDLSHSAVNIPSLSMGSHHDDFELGNFLRQVGTSHCFDPLVANGVTSLGQLSALTIVDLMNYGLTNSDASAILDSLRHAQQSSTLPRNRPGEGGGSFPNGYRTMGTSGRHSTRPHPRLHNPHPSSAHHQQNEGFFV